MRTPYFLTIVSKQPFKKSFSIGDPPCYPLRKTKHLKTGKHKKPQKIKDVYHFSKHSLQSAEIDLPTV